MDWETYPELLELVVKKHMNYYEDYLNFSGVCKLWRSIGVQAATKIPSRFPSLLLAEETEDAEFRQLFLLSNNSIRKIRLPEAYGKSCISSSGWLLTVENDTPTKLINPYSHETIDLPKIDSIFPDFLEYQDMDSGIRKVIFESPVVVVLWGCNILAFCRIGDNQWTHIETGSSGVIFNVTFYDRRVYYLDNSFRIRSYDVLGEDPIIVGVSRLPNYFSNEAPEVAYLMGSDDEDDEDVRYFYNDDLEDIYIVGLDDKDDGSKKLLVVIRELLEERRRDDVDGFNGWHVSYKTNSFRVFEYDLGNGKWLKVNNLGNKTLFVGFGSSFWIENTSGVIKGNCIYYTDHMPLFLQLSGNKSTVCCSKTEAKRDMGIYHMCDGTIDPHFFGELSSKVRSLIWLQSM